MNKISVIITAGGTSSRFGSENKLLVKISEKTVIEHTVDKFNAIEQIDQIIIPANVAIADELKKIIKSDKVIIVKGGNTRQKSVYNALQYVNNDYVLVHDGARPLINKSVIISTINKTIETGAVSVMTKTTDTIKEVDSSGKIIKTIDRSKLYNTQTPQGFRTSLLLQAHNELKNKNFTDDCSMLEELGIPVYIVEGNYTNIKITTKSDIDFAKIYI